MWLARAGVRVYSQRKINPPFDGDPHYRTDDRQPTIPQSHMALFWADIPIGRPIPVNADRWHSSACRSRVSAPDRRGSP